jgi:uncharacterized protein
MMGFGVSKLLVLILLIVAVWYGWRFLRRFGEVREVLRRAQQAAQAQRSGAAPRLQAEDMVKCRACGTYVAAQGATRCSRPGCPW